MLPMSEVVNGAASGALRIEPDSAEAALAKIVEVKGKLAALLRNGRGSSASDVQLGANPVGEAMAAKSLDRFSGGTDSLLVTAQALYDQAEQAEWAVRTAIANYREADSDAATTVGG